MQRAPELLVSQVLTKEKLQKKEKKKRKAKDGSTEKMKEKESKQGVRDTEEMVHWRIGNQEGINNEWKKSSRKMVEDVLEKYKAVVSKRGAYKGRGEPSVEDDPESHKNTSLENGAKIAGQESFRGSGSTICNESKACRRARRRMRR